MITEKEKVELVAYRAVIVFAPDRDGVQRLKPYTSKPHDRPGPAKAFITRYRKRFSHPIKDAWIEILSPSGRLE